MLFIITRITFWTIVLAIAIFLIMKSSVIHKNRWLIIAFITAVILTTITALIPIENTVITFSSPESAYNYNHSGDVKLIINGNQTAFVIGTKGDTDIYTIIPKVNNGFKISMGYDTQIVTQKIYESNSIYVYQYKNINEKYITVLNTHGDILDIKDNHNSQFKYLKNYNETLGKSFYCYYAYISEMNDQYTLYINGKSIEF